MATKMTSRAVTRITVGALLDAAWDAFYRHSLAYHAAAEEHGVRTLATYREVWTPALRALRRKYPGLPRERYTSAFERCQRLYDLVLTLIGQHGDRWLARNGAAGTCYGLVAAEYNERFRLSCPGFLLSTCQQALIRMYFDYMIR